MAKNKIKDRRKKTVKNFMKKKEAEVEAVKNSFCHFIFKEQPCKRCGKCCNAYAVQLTQDDLDREPKLLAVSRPIKPFEQETNNPDGIYCRLINTTEDNRRCPFYKDSIGCSIYKTRPNSCKDYIPSLCACLRGRLGSAGFKVESWYGDNKMNEYLETQLHRDTGLDPSKDNNVVCLYFLIIPFLISAEKVKHHEHPKKDGTLERRKYTIEDFIDVDKKIPDCIREFLQLDDKYKIIKELFAPHVLTAVVKKLKNES